MLADDPMGTFVRRVKRRHASSFDAFISILCDFKSGKEASTAGACNRILALLRDAPALQKEFVRLVADAG